MTLREEVNGVRARPGKVLRDDFGRLPSGEVIETVEIANARGLRLRVMTLGAAIQSLSTPDRDGHSDNVVLNYPELAPYIERQEFFGSLIGRYANRIGGAAFMLDGTRYELVANEGANILHGGAEGFHQVVWRIDAAEGGDAPWVRLSHRSADGVQGFPGTLDVNVTYSLNGDNEFRITLEATTDRLTIVSLTSHPYFNLGGAASGRDILGHSLMLAADAFTPIDKTMIPTGEVRDVAGTPFDFRKPQIMGERIRETGSSQIALVDGFDHNFVLHGGVTSEPRFAARLADPRSGRVLELFTTEPGLQLYTGQKLGTGKAKTTALYHRCAGMPIEPQYFPDSPNQPSFPSPRLEPGQVYRQVSVYRFSTAAH